MYLRSVRTRALDNSGRRESEKGLSASRRLGRLLLVLLFAWAAALAVACATPTPEATNSPIPTPTAVPSDTPIPTLTAVPSDTPAPTPTASPIPTNTPTAPIASPTASLPAASVPVYTYEIVRTYPHDRNAFTQGLIYEEGILYEGTGLNGRSSLRKVELESGKVLQILALPEQYFGEGITVYGDRVFQLTWQSRVGFVYDKESFELLQTFNYPSEGWGLTHDGEHLIMSDGTSTLHFLDPNTLEEVAQIEVHDANGPVVRLNELEYVEGEVYANVWQTDRIARIDPQSGAVSGWIHLGGLLTAADRSQPVDVLNGIAYDARPGRLFVTGKLWPKLFEIELVAEE